MRKWMSRRARLGLSWRKRRNGAGRPCWGFGLAILVSCLLSACKAQIYHGAGFDDRVTRSATFPLRSTPSKTATTTATTRTPETATTSGYGTTGNAPNLGERDDWDDLAGEDEWIDETYIDAVLQLFPPDSLSALSVGCPYQIAKSQSGPNPDSENYPSDSEKKEKSLFTGAVNEGNARGTGVNGRNATMIGSDSDVSAEGSAAMRVCSAVCENKCGGTALHNVDSHVLRFSGEQLLMDEWGNVQWNARAKAQLPYSEGDMRRPLFPRPIGASSRPARQGAATVKTQADSQSNKTLDASPPAAEQSPRIPSPREAHALNMKRISTCLRALKGGCEAVISASVEIPFTGRVCTIFGQTDQKGWQFSIDVGRYSAHLASALDIEIAYTAAIDRYASKPIPLSSASVSPSSLPSPSPSPETSSLNGTDLSSKTGETGDPESALEAQVRGKAYADAKGENDHYGLIGSAGKWDAFRACRSDFVSGSVTNTQWASISRFETLSPKSTLVGDALTDTPMKWITEFLTLLQPAQSPRWGWQPPPTEPQPVSTLPETLGSPLPRQLQQLRDPYFLDDGVLGLNNHGHTNRTGVDIRAKKGTTPLPVPVDTTLVSVGISGDPVNCLLPTGPLPQDLIAYVSCDDPTTIIHLRDMFFQSDATKVYPLAVRLPNTSNKCLLNPDRARIHNNMSLLINGARHLAEASLASVSIPTSSLTVPALLCVLPIFSIISSSH